MFDYLRNICKESPLIYSLWKEVIAETVWAFSIWLRVKLFLKAIFFQNGHFGIADGMPMISKKWLNEVS